MALLTLYAAVADKDDAGSPDVGVILSEPKRAVSPAGAPVNDTEQGALSAGATLHSPRRPRESGRTVGARQSDSRDGQYRPRPQLNRPR